MPITVPPLRDRGDDVLLLAEYFLEKFRREFRKPDLQLGKQTRARLLTYSWPGNVRELQNAIERAAILIERQRNYGKRAAIAGGAAFGGATARKGCWKRRFCGKGRWRKCRSGR